jgi:hypothetical protein
MSPLDTSATVWPIEGTTVHFYLAEPGKQAILVVSFKIAFSSVHFDVLKESVKHLFAFIFPLGFKVCHWK